MELSRSDIGSEYAVVKRSSHAGVERLVAFPEKLRPSGLLRKGCTSWYYVDFSNATHDSVASGIYQFRSARAVAAFYALMVQKFRYLMKTDVANQHPIPSAVPIGDKGVTASEFPFTPPPMRTLSQVVFRRGRIAVEVDTSQTSTHGGRTSVRRLASIIDRRIRKLRGRYHVSAGLVGGS